MKCLVMKLCDPPEPEHDEKWENINTLDDFAELVKKLGGVAQIQVTPKGWIVDDFRKLIKGNRND